MSRYDEFSHTVPANFDTRVKQLLEQYRSRSDLADAFGHCHYEIDDLGNAYQNAGMRGDNWDMNALDITIEGTEPYISIIKNNLKLVRDAMSKALKRSESGLLVHDVFCLVSGDIPDLPNTDVDRLRADTSSALSFLSDLVAIGSRLCANATYRSSSTENSINDYVRDQLQAMGYCEVRDQSRHGISPSGNDAGEVDFLVTKSGREMAIVEAMKLSGINRKYIENHFNKAINSYNPLGTATFIVTYVCSANFESWWREYLSFTRTFINVNAQLIERASPNASIRIASSTVSHEGFVFPLFIVAFKLAQ